MTSMDTGATSGGYCIEIRVDANNKVSVGVEPLKDEMSEEGAEGGKEESYQPVKSIQEAMAIVKDIYANAGNVKEGMAQSTNEMNEGYSE